MGERGKFNTVSWYPWWKFGATKWSSQKGQEDEIIEKFGDASWLEKFATELQRFLGFSKKLKSGHFVLQISPWKQHQQIKWSTPPWSQWKILLNCHLIFSKLCHRDLLLQSLQKFKLENMKKIVKTEELYSHIVRTSSDLKSKLISAYWSPICLFKSRSQYL